MSNNVTVIAAAVQVMRGWMRNTAELSSPSWDFTLDKRDQSSRKGISRSIFLEEK